MVKIKTLSKYSLLTGLIAFVALSWQSPCLGSNEYKCLKSIGNAADLLNREVNLPPTTKALEYSNVQDLGDQINRALVELKYPDLDELPHLEQVTSEILANPTHTINKAEEQELLQNPQTRKLSALFLKLHNLSRPAFKFVASTWTALNLALAPAPFSKPFSGRIKDKQTLLTKILKAPLQTLDGIAFITQQFFDPVPFLSNEAERKFFAPIWNKNKGPVDLQSDPQIHFNKTHPRWLRFRFVINRAMKALLLTSALLTANHYDQVSSKVITTQDYLNQPETQWQYRSRNQSMNDMESIPVDFLLDIGTWYTHGALQVNGRVYSFSFKFLINKNTEEYVNEHSLLLLSQDPKAPLEFNEVVSPRVIQVIRLNLKAPEVTKMIETLESQGSTISPNIAAIYDCVTKLTKVINLSSDVKIPEVINSSPSQIAMYLTALKSAGVTNSHGQPLVADAYTIVVERPDSPELALAKSIAFNYIESNMFTQSIIPTTVVRTVFDSLYRTEQRLVRQDSIEKSIKAISIKASAEFITQFRHDMVFSVLLNDLNNSQTSEMTKTKIKTVLTGYLANEQQKLKSYTEATSLARETRAAYEGQLQAISKLLLDFQVAPQ